MNEETRRRSFLKQMLAILAAGAGSAISFKRSDGPRFGIDLSEAKAENSGAKVKKIACEEHAHGAQDDFEKRLRDMDEAGIDMQVINFVNFNSEEAKASNDSLAELVHKKYPGRFAGYCNLPWKDPDAAPEELRRAVNDLGLKGPMVFAGQASELYLDDRKFWGIYEMAEKLDVPVYIHPGALLPDMSGPYKSPYPILSMAMWGFSALTGLHAMRLIVSGVFDKYPRLKIMLGHMGEGIPYWLWRMDKHYSDDQAVIGKDEPGNNLQKLPSEYFKNNFYVTMSGMCWEPVLKFVITALGADRILFACDYPPEPALTASKFIDAVSISDDERQKICHLNAEKLLKL